MASFSRPDWSVFPGLTMVRDFRSLFEIGPLKDREVVRLFKAAHTLRGDFDAVARRLAIMQRDITGNLELGPIALREGRVLLSGEDILSNWKLLVARYNPFGPMTRKEKQAFDILAADIKQVDDLDGGALVSLVYSNKPVDHYDVSRFHMDHESLLMRCYNQAATLFTHRDDVTLVTTSPDDEYFSLKPGGREYAFDIGDYWFHRGLMDSHNDPAQGFIHRAPDKTPGDTPRILLTAFLA